MGDRQLYFKLLRLFVLDQRSAISKVREALLESDYKTAEMIAHTLKGVAGLIGADVQLLAARIESQIEGLTSIEQMTALLDNAERQLQSTIVEIEKSLQSEQDLGDLHSSSMDKNLSTENVHEKLRACYKLIANFDGDAMDMLNASIDELNIAFGSDVQKQIMRAASQYDFDVIQSIMKGNAHMIGLSLE
jgi:two-component system sensor histidine kinase/response regulator